MTDRTFHNIHDAVWGVICYAAAIYFGLFAFDDWYFKVLAIPYLILGTLFLMLIWKFGRKTQYGKNQER